MTTPKQKFKALKLTPASPDGNSRGCEVASLSAHGYDYADRIIRLGHTGWFTDSDGGEKIRGEVWELADDNDRKPSIFLAGYTEENGAYICLSCTRGTLDTFEEASEAARAADGLAESHAEREREYQERWQEACRCADEIASAKSDAAIARKNWRTLRNAARVPGMTGNESADLVILAEEKREEHSELIARIVEKRERIAELDMTGEF
jgi:hypothetical protein